jgi:hypothetical protein
VGQRCVRTPTGASISSVIEHDTCGRTGLVDTSPGQEKEELARSVNTGHLARADRTVGRTPRAGQLHSVRCAPVPTSPRDVVRISLCTVRSPLRFLRSSGDSPGSSPCALRRLCRSRWSANIAAPRCWNACRHRLTMEEDTAHVRHTSSRVVLAGRFPSPRCM